MTYDSSSARNITPENLIHIKKSEYKLPLPQGYIIDKETQGIVPSKKDIDTLKERYCAHCAEMPGCDTRIRILEKLLAGKYFEFQGNIKRLVKESNDVQGPLVDVHCSGYWSGQFDLNFD